MANFTYDINSAKPWPIDFQNPQQFFPIWVEKTDVMPWKQFMMDYPNLSYYSCAIYLAVIFSLQSYMKTRPPIKATNAMIAWNTFLAIFSALGAFRIGQELFHNLALPDGYYASVCRRGLTSQPSQFWGLLFVLSKFLEFGDTVFIVLRKGALLPLQWYHHCLVTVFAWKLFPWGEPILSYYAVINFGVHAFMYTYFAIRGLRIRVPEAIAMCITTLQISQMVINTVNNIYSVGVLNAGYPCSRHPTSIQWSFVVYISLWVLFAKFFADRYYSKKKVKKID